MQTEASNAKLASNESPPLADLVGRLSSDLKLLAREETELAKRELGAKLDEAKLQAANMALGAAALAGGALVLLAAAVLGLAQLMAAWLAALIVGAVVVAGGGALLLAGKAKLSRLDMKPEKTLQNVRRDVAAIKGAAT